MNYKDLCLFAYNFPVKAAHLLEVGGSLRHNVREETITDLMMVELMAFKSLGIHVDFPEDESETGQDMDWEFIAPYAINGRRYFRLHIQAKRAIQQQIRSPYL